MKGEKVIGIIVSYGPKDLFEVVLEDGKHTGGIQKAYYNRDFVEKNICWNPRKKQTDGLYARGKIIIFLTYTY